MAESEETRMVAEVRQKLSKVEGRDIQLWSINLLTLLVVAAGLAALLLPKLIWNLESLHLDARYLPQLFFGFISLIVLFNIYTLQQRRTLRETRDELMRQLLRTVAAEKLSLIDPLTQVFNRRYMEEILAKEVSRAERRGSALTFLVIDVDRFKSVNTRFGHLGGDRLLNSVAQLLTSTFRKSDTVVRSGGDEFVAILPDTNEQQATRVWERLLAKVNDWNRENSLPGYNLSLSCGLSTYTKGADVKDLLEKADKRMYLQKADRTALA